MTAWLRNVRFGAHSGLNSDIGPCPVRADSVEKVLLGWRTKISETADALRARRREGPHHFIQKRPPVFASAVEGFAPLAASKNRLSRDFRGRSIFDFCNSICQYRTHAPLSGRLPKLWSPARLSRPIWLVGPAGSNLQPDRYERRILPENPWWNRFRVSNLKE
jgi:hypothetical protein